MTKLILPIFALLSFFNAYAEDFSFGAVNADEVALKQYTQDSTANAVVLKEYGRTRFSFDDQTGEISLVFIHHVRLKIFNKNGAEHANIVIPLYKNGDREEYLEALKAVTLNVNETGRKEEVWLETKNSYREAYSKYVTLTKFTMPDIQNGSIIEYSYQITSPRLYNFRKWEFQTDIPKIHSEYDAIIPGTYNYNVVMRGPYKLTNQKSTLLREGFRLPGWPIDCSQMTYIMENVPAFIEEDYMTAAANFKSAIYFELADMYLRNGSKRSFTKEWKNVERELITDRSFGVQAKQKDEFKDIVPGILQDIQGDLNKAKAIFSFIKKQIKWNNYYGIFSEMGVKKALAQHTGNIADINFSLFAGLTAAGLEAEIVILSTRDNGIVNKLNPVISEFNYLITKLTIDGESYLLDASDPLLPFGTLPLRCINDEGRVIPLKGASYWMTIAPKEKHNVQYILAGELLNDGTLKGVLTTNSYGYAAYLKRKEILSYPTVDEYIEKKVAETPGMQVVNERISGLDTTESKLQERWEVSIDLFDSLQYQQLFFNPFFINKLSKNPFNLSERTYPVDIGMLNEESLMLDIKLPVGYEVISMPKDLNLALVEKGGQFINRTQVEGNHLRCNQLFRLNKMVYAPEEYLSLKEFFSRIIQLQKTDVILQKKTI